MGGSMQSFRSCARFLRSCCSFTHVSPTNVSPTNLLPKLVLPKLVLPALVLLTFVLPISSVFVFADNPPAARMSPKTRQEILHSFSDELVYIRTTFPMGKTGLKLKDGTLTPNGEELRKLMVLWGPAVKPGDRARISSLIIKEDHIRFEINGGPVKREKWYQHISVSGTGGASANPVSPGDPNTNARGSFVDLYFDKYVPELTGPDLKKLLRPVFDFDARTPLQAYLTTVSPKVRDAITNHKVLVGMNQEMVIYAKGRPPKRVREKDGDTDYEEWIYGLPPEDVDFVRFVGDEVVRVETMSIDGKKIVRLEKEVDAEQPTVAKKQDDERPSNAPSLRRPGEEMPDARPATLPSGAPMPMPDPRPVPSGSDPGPNYVAASTSYFVIEALRALNH